MIDGLDKASGTLKKAMEYSLLSGGKKLRPILALSSAEAVGGKDEDALSAAVALELIHTYSLIHDDLPAMDNDDYRRGIPTNHKVFGEACAVLAGDALLTKAFSILTDNSHVKHNPEKLIAITHEIAEAAGVGGMLGGQMADIESEKNDIELAALEFIHIRKTGALILASVRSGAILGGGSDDQIERLSEYGKNLGLAFQISDDILDVIGDDAAMGKKVQKDHVRGKATYPALLGLSESKNRAEELVENALSSIDGFDDAARPLRAIGRYIIERQT